MTTQIIGEQQTHRAEYLRWAARQRILGGIFRGAATFFGLFVLLLLGGVIVALIEGAWPALSHFGLDFITTESWNPVTEKFGAIAPIYGTVVTSLIAMAIGLPISFGIAIFITELCPGWLRRPIGTAI